MNGKKVAGCLSVCILRDFHWLVQTISFVIMIVDVHQFIIHCVYFFFREANLLHLQQQIYDK